MELCPLVHHLAAPDRLHKLHAAFRRRGGYLTLDQFRAAVLTIAPDVNSLNGDANDSIVASVVDDADGCSFLSPLVDSAPFSNGSPLMDDNATPHDGTKPHLFAVADENADSADRLVLLAPDLRCGFPAAHAISRSETATESECASPLLESEDEARFVHVHAFRPPAAILSSSPPLQPQRDATSRGRVVVFGESPPTTNLAVGTSSPASSPQTQHQIQSAFATPHALPVYRIPSITCSSNHSVTSETQVMPDTVSRRVTRLQVRDELSQCETTDPVRRLFYRLDREQTGFVEWETVLDALVDETHRHEDALAEDHRSYVFSRSRAGKPVRTNATAEYVTDQERLYRDQLGRHRALANAVGRPLRSSDRRSVKGKKSRERTRAPLRSSPHQHIAHLDTSLMTFVDGLPSHPALFAVSSHTLPLGLFNKTTLDLVKAFDVSDLGGATPELVDYLPGPDLLVTYASRDRHLRGVMAAAASAVCVSSVTPLRLEHTVRRLRTCPSHFPSTLFCGLSNGDVLLVDVPAAPRADTTFTVTNTFARVHTEASGGVLDFVVDRRRLFTVGYDQRLRAVELDTGALTDVAVLEDPLRFLTLNRTRHLLVGATFRGELRVWDTKAQSATRGSLLRLQGHRAHKSQLVSLVSVPERPEVITVDMSGTVRVWDLRQLACVQSTRLDGTVDDDAGADVLYGTDAATSTAGGAAHDGGGADASRASHPKTMTPQYLCAYRGAVFLEPTEELLGYTADALYGMRSNCQADERMADWDVVLHTMFDSQTNTFVLQGPSRTTFWDGTFGHRKRVVDRATDSRVPAAAREVTACCVDGVSGHLFLATAVGDVEVHLTHAMEPTVPLRRLRVPDGYVTDMHYCEGIRLLVGVGTTGSLLLCSEDPQNRFFTNMALSHGPLYHLTVSENLGLAAFTDDRQRIIVQDIKKLAGTSYHLALDRRTLDMTLTGDAAMLATAHESQLVVLWSVPPALEVFAQLAVFRADTHELSAEKMAYHCFHSGLMDKGPVTVRRRAPDPLLSAAAVAGKGKSVRLARRSTGGGDSRTSVPLIPADVLGRLSISDTDVTTTNNSHNVAASRRPRTSTTGGEGPDRPHKVDRSARLLSTLLNSTVREWVVMPATAELPTATTATAGVDAAASAEAASVNPWNAAQIEFDITALAFHEPSHHLFVGNEKGDVHIYALCSLLQVYEIRCSTYESRPRFSLRVPSNADVQLGKTAPQHLRVIHAVHGGNAVVSLCAEPTLQVILCTGQDRSVSIFDDRGAEAGYFSMRRLPPTEWLQGALDSSSADTSVAESPNARTAKPGSTSARTLTEFRLPRRAVPLRAISKPGAAEEDAECLCAHKIRLKPLAPSVNLQDVSFLTRTVHLCLNDSLRLGLATAVLSELAHAKRPDSAGRPPSGTRTHPRQGRVTPIDTPAACTDDSAAGAASQMAPRSTLLHDELTNARFCGLVAGTVQGGFCSSPGTAAVNASARDTGPLLSSHPLTVRDRPGTAQAATMRSLPTPTVSQGSPPTSRPATSPALGLMRKPSTIRLGSAAPLAVSPHTSPFSASLPIDSDHQSHSTRHALPPVEKKSPQASPKPHTLTVPNTPTPRRRHPLSADATLNAAPPLRPPTRPCTGLTSRAAPRLHTAATTSSPDACQDALNRMVSEYQHELQRCLTRASRAPQRSGRVASGGPPRHSEMPLTDALSRQAPFS